MNVSSVVSPVSFTQVVEDFNQSNFAPSKVDARTARFHNVVMRLDNVQWNAPGSTAEIPALKQVDVTTNRAGVETTVKAYAIPGSSLNIVSGYMKDVPSEQATASLALPKNIGNMFVDLSKRHQDLLIRNQQPKEVTIQGSGGLQVQSKPVIYQGTFTANASFTGPVTFTTVNGRSATFGIEEMAREADRAGCLRPPFQYRNGALCWQVMGNIDITMENVNVIRKH